VVSLSNQFAEILIAAGLTKSRYEGRSHIARGIGRSAKREGAELSFHCLRHTAVSLLKDAGVPDAVVMALVGHDTVAMSQHYTHVGKEALAQAANKMPDLKVRTGQAALGLLTSRFNWLETEFKLALIKLLNCSNQNVAYAVVEEWRGFEKLITLVDKLFRIYNSARSIT
jgi:formylmethanofuran dehydrogenase subunit B